MPTGEELLAMQQSSGINQTPQASNSKNLNSLRNFFVGTKEVDPPEYIAKIKSLGYQINSTLENRFKTQNQQKFLNALSNLFIHISANPISNSKVHKIVRNGIELGLKNQHKAMQEPINSRLENFLKKLKNGKNIQSKNILNYARKLGYEVTSNSISELRSKVQTKNLKRPNQNKIKTSFIKLINKKIANIDKQKKLTEIKSKIQSNNPSNVLNGIYNAGYKNLNMVPQKLIKNYFEKSQFEDFGKALKKIKENINIQNENIEKNIKNRINKILKTLPNPTQPPGPPPTQTVKQNNSKSANPPPTQTANPPPGPKGNFAVVFNNGKPTNLKVKMNSPKPGVFTILSPPGTAKTLNLVMRNGFIMIVKKKGA